jgi:hypothetical protein
MQKNIRYEASGIVAGNCWGGGVGYYDARSIESNSYKDLINQIKSSLKDGSLDAGMGFEKLIKAEIRITKITEIKIDNKIFKNETISSNRHFFNG